VTFATALERLYTILNTLSPTRLVIKASPYIKQNLQWELRMKPFSCLSHFTRPPAPPAAAPLASTSLDLGQVRENLVQVHKVLDEAKTGFIALLQLPVSSSIEHAIAVGALAREQQWMKDIKSEMRSVVSTGLVVARVLRFVGERIEEDKKSHGEDEDERKAGTGEKKKIAWHVEEIDEAGARKGGGFGCWVVPVIDV